MTFKYVLENSKNHNLDKCTLLKEKKGSEVSILGESSCSYNRTVN